MKNIFAILLLVLSFWNSYSQNIGINATGAAPHASAMLDVSSTTKGFLIPRMTTAQRTAIASPATGLQVYDTDNKSCWFYNGTAWAQLSVGSNGWSLTGNAATNPASNFIGTTDNQPLRFRVNNVWSGEIHPTTNNTFLGLFAGQANTTGTANTAIGENTFTSNATGAFNTSVGLNTLSNNIGGNYNIAIGERALQFNNADNNVALGGEALRFNTTGISNTANGYQALYSNTIGNFNTANGYKALFSNTTGNFNTVIGDNALFNNISGSFNIAIGYNSGTIGVNAAALFNTISIGNSGANASNLVGIGNENTTFIGGNVPWSVISDARVKNSIIEDVKGLDFIMKLRPVTYHVSSHAITMLTGNKETPDFPGKYDGEKIKYSGFLAQEVEQAAKNAGYDFSGYSTPKNKWSLYTLSYEQFVVPLVKAMQEQQIIIDGLKKQMAEMKIEMELLKKKN